MNAGSALLGIIWAVGFIVIVVLVMFRRKQRRGGTMTAAVGAVWDLQTDQKRKAYEIILEKRAERRDPEDADGDRDPFTQLEYQGWQRVAGKYQDTWAGLTAGFIEPLSTRRRATGQRVLNVAGQACAGRWPARC